MARPVKKAPEQWEEAILDAAETLFLSKGYEETTVMQKSFPSCLQSSISD